MRKPLSVHPPYLLTRSNKELTVIQSPGGWGDWGLEVSLSYIGNPFLIWEKAEAGVRGWEGKQGWDFNLTKRERKVERGYSHNISSCNTLKRVSNWHKHTKANGIRELVTTTTKSSRWKAYFSVISNAQNLRSCFLTKQQREPRTKPIRATHPATLPPRHWGLAASLSFGSEVKTNRKGKMG